MLARVETNASNEKLQEHMLTDAELAMCEAEFPGKIRVESVGRYNARLSVNMRSFSFTLRKFNEDERELVIDGDLTYLPTCARDLVWHKAAEAIMARRRGDMEFRRKPKLKEVLRKKSED